jgi:hypothetical protein
MSLSIHIHTQYRENYGTEAEPYWKFKGGSTRVIDLFAASITDGIGAEAQAVVDAARGLIEYANPMSEEYIIDWELVDTGTLTEDERLDREYGSGTYQSPRIGYSDGCTWGVFAVPI